MAADGAYVGLTGLLQVDSPSGLAFGLTGVRRDHRRRGCTDLRAGDAGTLDAPIVRANPTLGISIEPLRVTLMTGP